MPLGPVGIGATPKSSVFIFSAMPIDHLNSRRFWLCNGRLGAEKRLDLGKVETAAFVAIDLANRLAEATAALIDRTREAGCDQSPRLN